jgi:protein SCO1/2
MIQAKSTSARTTLLYALVAAIAVLAGLFVAAYTNQVQQPEHALVFSAPRTLADFSLVDHRGGQFGRQQLTGSWNLLFFGFTRCPDVCPTTLQTLAAASRKLDDLPRHLRPSVIMVTVDPMRDTVEALAAYVPYFDPDFVGVTGDMIQIQTLTREMGVAYAYTPGIGSDDYGVEHTASIFMFNPDGNLVAIFSTPHSVDGIETDYRIIVGNLQ